MEVKNKKEITYSISDIKTLIEQHILDNDLSSKGDAYKMECIVKPGSAYNSYSFEGIKVIVEIKE